MRQRPGDELFERPFDQCLFLPMAARWLNVSAVTTRRWPQVSLRRAGSVCVQRRASCFTRFIYARRNARLASIEAIIAVTTLKKMVYVKSAWMKNIPVQAESAKSTITVIWIPSTIMSRMCGSDRAMRSELGSAIAAALASMLHCFVERSSGTSLTECGGWIVPFNVSLGGISLSECDRVTISFPSKHTREKPELQEMHRGHDRKIQRYWKEQKWSDLVMIEWCFSSRSHDLSTRNTNFDYIQRNCLTWL